MLSLQPRDGVCMQHGTPSLFIPLANCRSIKGKLQLRAILPCCSKREAPDESLSFLPPRRPWIGRQKPGCKVSLGSNVAAAAALAAAPSADAAAAEAADAAPGQTRPTAAELARTVAEICREGTLTTVSPDGWPLGTYVQYALDGRGRPVLRLEPGATHTRHLDANDCCSLHTQVELPGQQKPQCTIKGRLSRQEPDGGELPADLEKAWAKRFGAEGAAAAAAARQLCWLEVDEVLGTRDVGEEEVWIAGPEYGAAAPDPLRDAAARIVHDFNRDYWEDVRRFPAAYAGLGDEVEDARIVWVDRLGLDVRVLLRGGEELRDVRIPFPGGRPLAKEADARSAVTLMAQLAWEAERAYIPPHVPLLGSTQSLV